MGETTRTRFDAFFWVAYPNKKGKNAAWALWQEPAPGTIAPADAGSD